MAWMTETTNIHHKHPENYLISVSIILQKGLYCVEVKHLD